MSKCPWCDQEVNSSDQTCPNCQQELVRFAEVHRPQSNQLNEKANKNLKRFILCIIPIVIYFLLILFGVVNMVKLGIFHVLIFIVFALPARYFYKQYRIASSGSAGEAQTLEYLSGLPSGYQVFANVRVTFGQYSKEMDAVVIGDNGLFIIEAKNHNGNIDGSAVDNEWTQYKVGRKGTPYSKTFRNPTKQVAGQIATLSKALKSAGEKVWIQGVVVFTNPSVQLRISGKTDIPVMTAYELNTYILSCKPKEQLSAEEIARIGEWLLKHQD